MMMDLVIFAPHRLIRDLRHVCVLAMCCLLTGALQAQDVSDPQQASGIELTGRPGLAPMAYWKVYDADTDEEVASVNERWGFTELPAGSYYVTIQQDSTNLEVRWADVVVSANEITTIQIDTAIEWAVDPEDMAPPYEWVVFDFRTRDRVAQVFGRWGFTPVPYGDYRVYLRSTPRGEWMPWSTKYRNINIGDSSARRRLLAWYEQDPPSAVAAFKYLFFAVREEHVDAPIMDTVVKAALQGMMEELSPYSSYVDAQTFRELQATTEVDSGTTGLAISKYRSFFPIIAVERGSSAAKEGILAGDSIEQIDGRPLAPMSLWEAQRRLRGPVGSTVSVRVIRHTRSVLANLDLVRQEPVVAEVSARMVEPGIALLRIPNFKEGVAEDVGKALRNLLESNPTALIIDVRRNTRGELGEVVRTADWFLPADAIVMSLRHRQEQAQELRTTQPALLSQLPITILINRSTSGPAEMFVAAFKDHEVATTIGGRTPGWGGVQERFDLDDGSVVFMATKVALRPSGQPLQQDKRRDSGVSADLVWPDSGFSYEFYYENVPEESRDNLTPDFYRALGEAREAEELRKAIEQIREPSAKRKTG